MTDTERYRSIWMHLARTSFRQDWIDVGGVKTRYVQAGKRGNPAVIMLHGTAGSWEAFCANLGPHAEQFDCYAIDMAGSGFSDKPDVDYEIPFYVAHVKAFMDTIGLKRTSFIGVSLGAWVAARFAVIHPDAINKMTLLSASGLIANRATMQRIRGERSKAADSPTWETIKPIFKNLIHEERNRIDDLVALRLSLYRLPNAKQAMSHVLVLQDPDVRARNLITEDEWRSIKAPTLAVGSVDDPNDYLETARRIAKLIPNGRYVEMKQVAHWPQFEDPERFNPLNIAFLRE